MVRRFHAVRSSIVNKCRAIEGGKKGSRQYNQYRWIKVGFFPFCLSDVGWVIRVEPKGAVFVRVAARPMWKRCADCFLRYYRRRRKRYNIVPGDLVCRLRVRTCTVGWIDSVKCVQEVFVCVCRTKGAETDEYPEDFEIHGKTFFFYLFSTVTSDPINRLYFLG